jgi:hypothetical protein
VGKRCKARIKEISDEKKSMNINVKIEDVNTDI